MWACHDAINPYIWFTHPEFHIKITRQLINGMYWSNTGPWPHGEHYIQPPHYKVVVFFNTIYGEYIYVVCIWDRIDHVIRWIPNTQNILPSLPMRNMGCWWIHILVFVLSCLCSIFFNRYYQHTFSHDIETLPSILLNLKKRNNLPTNGPTYMGQVVNPWPQTLQR